MKRKILAFLFSFFLTFSIFSTTSFASEKMVKSGSLGAESKTTFIDPEGDGIILNDETGTTITTKDLFNFLESNLTEEQIDVIISYLELIGIEDFDNLANYLYQNNLFADMPNDIDGAIKYLDTLKESKDFPEEHVKTIEKIDLLYKIIGSYFN